MKCFWFLTIMAVLLTGCTKEAEELPDKGTQIPLSVSSASISAVFTKTDPSLLNSGSIGLFLLSNTGGYTPLYNVEYDYGLPAWTAQSTIIYLDNNNASVCAYYPLGAAGISSSSDPSAINLTSQKYKTTEDLCFAAKNSNSLNNSTPSIDFTMKHAYSRITFTIDKDVTTYEGPATIRNITLYNPGIMTANTLDITSGTYGSVSPSGTFSYDPQIYGISTTATSSILMIPSVMSGSNITLSFNVDGTTLTTPLSTSSMSDLQAGSEYNVHVTIKGRALIISSVTTIDWEPADCSGVIL